MNIKTILIPLLLATQVCYGADGKALENFMTVHMDVVDTQERLGRIAVILGRQPDKTKEFAQRIKAAVKLFNAQLREVETALTECDEQPRSEVPQPKPQPKREFLSVDAFPGLQGGSDNEDDKELGE